MATETALAISYRTLGVDFSSVLGLANELAIATDKMMAARRRPSVAPSSKAAKLTSPSS